MILNISHFSYPWIPYTLSLVIFLLSKRALFLAFVFGARDWWRRAPFPRNELYELWMRMKGDL
jgi:hypothetical protein